MITIFNVLQVKLYQTHWWRCNGPCQTRKPYFGIVRRSQNRAPGPSECWWLGHQKMCGGTFIKIKEPEKKPKKSAAEKKNTKNGDITKYVNNKTNTKNKINEIRKPLTPIVKNVTGTPGNKMKSNGGNTVVITQKSVSNSPISKPLSQPSLVFAGKGQTVHGGRQISNSSDVVEAVRNVWAKKQLPGLANSQPVSKRKSISSSNTVTANNTILKSGKQKEDSVNTGSPPAKIKKIDDYFKNAATSVLKDIYGQDFRLTQIEDKIVAMATTKVNLVDCPICNVKVDSTEINRHLDECLNIDVIEKLTKDNIKLVDTKSKSQISDTSKIVNNISSIPVSQNSNNYVKMFKEENGDVKPLISTTVDLTNTNYTNQRLKSRNSLGNVNNESEINFDSNDVNRVKEIVKKINYDKHVNKSDNTAVVKEKPKNVDCGFLPSFLDDLGCAINAPKVKIEPGTSKDIVSALTEQKCPCCGTKINKPMAEHLDECLSFFDNNTTIPEEGASTSFANNTIVIDDDDDDIFDETLTLNATGTKTPCPCCLEMIEMAQMNIHLDDCLS